MFSSGVLDVAIGLSFVYLLLSLICTVVNEWLAGVLRLRARTLKKGISHLLESGLRTSGLERALYDHPLVRALDTPGYLGARSGRPSYIPARTFALALLDVLPKTDKGALDMGAGRAFAALSRGAGESPEVLQQRIENWFDDSMDRVSG